MVGRHLAPGRVVNADSRKLRLVAPEEPLRLTPGAARALLKILLKAAASRTETDQTREGTET
jgi:hypothetical protein